MIFCHRAGFIPLYHFLYHEMIIIQGGFGAGPEPYHMPIRNAYNLVVGEIPRAVMKGDGKLLNKDTFNWAPWEGERGLWGVVTPKLDRRRGTFGVYHQPREILKAIPGVELVEMPRIRENAFCCGAGRGVKEAFPEFASWAAEERLTEVKEVGAEAVVSACPWCKNNFSKAVGENGESLKVFDISELVLASVGV